MNDCVLGSLGFLLGFIGTLLMPWPRNTITYYVGDTLVTSTMKSYQRSDQVGIVIAIVLTLLRELYRFNRSNGSDNRHAGYGSARLTRNPDI